MTEADLQGSWILMYFGYTSSPDVGPEEVQKMAEAIEILGAFSMPTLVILTGFTVDNFLWATVELHCH